MTKAERYVQLRLDGAGARDAAREAGFAHGVPSPEARELHEACEAMEKVEDAGWLREHEAELEASLKQIRLLLRARKLLGRFDRATSLG